MHGGLGGWWHELGGGAAAAPGARRAGPAGPWWRRWRTRQRGPSHLYRRRRQQGRRRHARRDEVDVRYVVHAVGQRQGRLPDAGAAPGGPDRGPAGTGAPGGWRRFLPGSGPCGTTADTQSRARAGHDGGTPGHSARQTEAAAQGAGPRQGRRVRALIDSHRRPDHRGARQEDRRVDHDDHLQLGRHQRGEPQAVRRDLPGEHDGRVSRRSQRCGRDSGPPEGAPRLRARRERPRGHPRGDRFVSSEPALD